MTNTFFKKVAPFSLKKLGELCGAKNLDSLPEDVFITDVKPLEEGDESSISYYDNPKYLTIVGASKSKACIVKEEKVPHLPPTMLPIIVDLPYRSYGKVLSIFYPAANNKASIHPTAIIDPSASLGDGVSVGPYAIIEGNVTIGEATVIEGFCHIKENVTIGKNCHLHSQITLSHAIIGDMVIIKPGARIGQTGFGFFMDEKGHFDVPQLGCVVIGNDVIIGSNTTIDRGSLHDTIIGNGVRIDNLVQIGHNVKVGDNSVLVAQVGIAGSTELGKFVIAAGQVGIAGHLKIGDGAKIAAQSGIMRDLNPREAVAGSPAIPVRDWHKQTIALSNLIKKGNK